MTLYANGPESNRPDPVTCTTCRELVGPPELPVLSWDRPAPHPGAPRPEPDHVEHRRCNLRRVPRFQAVRMRGAA